MRSPVSFVGPPRYIKLLEGIPPVRGAITGAGLTTRDYVLTQGALLQAGMTYAMTKDGSVSADKVIEQVGVSRANLEFYQKNEAEIGAPGQGS